LRSVRPTDPAGAVGRWTADHAGLGTIPADC
jgi:hypothetical protein